MEDKIIIKYIKKQKEEGLKMLIDKYGGLIKAILNKNLYNLDIYEDECMNDILLSIWNNIDKFEHRKGNFKNWIVSISKYKCIDYKRKYLKNIQDEELNEDIVDVKNANVHENLLREEIKTEIEDLLSNLNEIDKHIFMKLYFEDMDMDEISENMNLKKPYIYNRISRAKSKLRKLILAKGEAY